MRLRRLRAMPRSVACAPALGAPPHPPLGLDAEFASRSAPAPASPGTPLRTADHPATPWWSALLRGEDEAGAGAGGVQEMERRAGRGWR
jgi:hypothetical protein